MGTKFSDLKQTIKDQAHKLKHAWGDSECPGCQSAEVTNDYLTGEMYCLKCGLIIM